MVQRPSDHSWDYLYWWQGAVVAAVCPSAEPALGEERGRRHWISFGMKWTFFYVWRGWLRSASSRSQAQ